MARNNRIFAAITTFFAAIGALLFARSARGSETVGTAPGTPTGDDDTVVLVVQGTSPLGLRNNNPFNLEFRNIGWVGEVGTDGRFSIFDNAENGIRAGMINVHTKMTRDGANTVRRLLSILSPAFENPLESFITFVSRRLGVAPDQPINFPQHILQLSQAIIQFENGTQPFSIEELQRALSRTGRV